MRYNYCPKCDRAYIKSRLEKDLCIYCGGRCEAVDVKRNGMYYVGYVIMLAGAIAVLLPRFILLTNPELFIAAGLGMAVGGSVVIVMANGVMTKNARDRAIKRAEEED